MLRHVNLIPDFPVGQMSPVQWGHCKKKQENYNLGGEVGSNKMRISENFTFYITYYFLENSEISKDC